MTSPQEYLRYASYLYVLYAAVTVVVTGFFGIVGSPVVFLGGLVALAVQALLFVGLQRGSTLAWLVHMLLSLTSILGLLGLALGWLGRAAAIGSAPAPAPDAGRPAPSGADTGVTGTPTGDGSADAGQAGDADPAAGTVADPETGEDTTPDDVEYGGLEYPAVADDSRSEE